MTINQWYAFDTETGGLSPWEHPLLSVGTAYFKDGRVLNQSEFLVTPDPEKTISPKALEINGLDVGALEEAEDAFHHRDAGEVMRINLQSMQESGVPLVGHNMTFDITYIMVNAGRPGAELGSEYMFFDTKLLVRHFAPEHQHKNLGELCEMFGIPLDNAHNAVADATATGLLFGALLREYPEIESWSAEELRAIMEEEFDGQTAGYSGRLAFDRFGSATEMSMRD